MKRESRSGIDIIGKNPPPLDLATPEGRQRAMQDVLRSLGKGYTKDYEIMIRQYFERLQKHRVDSDESTMCIVIWNICIRHCSSSS